MRSKAHLFHETGHVIPCAAALWKIVSSVSWQLEWIVAFEWELVGGCWDEECSLWLSAVIVGMTEQCRFSIPVMWTAVIYSPVPLMWSSMIVLLSHSHLKEGSPLCCSSSVWEIVIHLKVKLYLSGIRIVSVFILQGLQPCFNSEISWFNRADSYILLLVPLNSICGRYRVPFHAAKVTRQ
jgi:hypothetical protein